MNNLLEKIFTKILDATLKKKNSFKYGSLANSYSGFPNQRMVVLRSFKNNEIIIYTDLRSQKVSKFSLNPKASLLLFDPETMEQVILKGTIALKKNNLENIWKTIPEYAHRDYNSVFSPGEPIDSKNAKYSNTEHHFCILKFSFTEIDYLKIEKPYNYRAQFKMEENNNWSGTYVVP